MKTLAFIVFFIGSGSVSANAHPSSHLDTAGSSTLGLLSIMIAVLLVTISSTPYLKKSPIECKKDAPEPLENDTESATQNVRV